MTNQEEPVLQIYFVTDVFIVIFGCTDVPVYTELLILFFCYIFADILLHDNSILVF